MPDDLHVVVSPDRIRIKGRTFDPVKHFERWREQQDRHRMEKPVRKAVAAQAMIRLSAQGLCGPALADVLNAEGVKTPTGKTWTAANIRKFRQTLAT